MFGPTLRRFPDLKVALSEGGIGWIPFYLDRIDRHFTNQEWMHSDFGGKLPSEVFRDHILACYITDPSGLDARDRIGIDIIAWECDYPHTDTTWPESPEFAWKEFQDGRLPDEEIHKITWENAVALLQLGPLRPHPEGAGDRGRRCARQARDVDVTRMSKDVAQRVARLATERHSRAGIDAGRRRGGPRSAPGAHALGLSDDQEFFRETTERFLSEQVPPDAVR